MFTTILVIVLATSNSFQTGSTSVVAEFNSLPACIKAEKDFLEKAQKRGNCILTSGCYPKQ